MRTHETRWITMNTTCGKALLRIKSPQLYRLSYQPKITKLLALVSLMVSGVRAIVPAVCLSLISGRRYHAEAGPDDSDVFQALRRNVSGGNR